MVDKVTICSLQGENPFNYYVLLLNVYTNTLYWLFGVSLILMEYFNQPKKFYKYKIQPENSALNDKRKLFKVKSNIHQLK